MDWDGHPQLGLGQGGGHQIGMGESQKAFHETLAVNWMGDTGLEMEMYIMIINKMLQDNHKYNI